MHETGCCLAADADGERVVERLLDVKGRICSNVVSIIKVKKPLYLLR